jgi:hypothetical protein
MVSPPTDPIDKLNSLAKTREENSVRFQTTEQLRELFCNPTKFRPPTDEPLQEAIDNVVDLFLIVCANDRRVMTSRLNRYAQSALLAYASSMSQLAVQLSSPVSVHRGLIALAAEGGNLDIRDSIAALASLNDSATSGSLQDTVWKTEASIDPSRDWLE